MTSNITVTVPPGAGRNATVEFWRKVIVLHDLVRDALRWRVSRTYNPCRV
jgi:hypothetical protein